VWQVVTTLTSTSEEMKERVNLGDLDLDKMTIQLLQCILNWLRVCGPDSTDSGKNEVAGEHGNKP
jgi:hypothetical protein